MYDDNGNVIHFPRVTPISTVVAELKGTNDIPDKFTGSITINCHEGNVSSKVEIKKTIKIK